MAVAVDHRETYTKSLLPFLDRTRTIARPGYSRWIDAACGALRASVHRAGLRLERIQPADDQASGRFAIGPRRLEAHRAGLDLFNIAMVFLGSVGGGVRQWVEERRPAQGDVHRRALLGERVFRRRRSASIPAYALDHLSRLWRDRRLCAWHRLHLAGIDADEMVSGSPRDGDGHGHHGFRWRRPDCVAALGLADEQVRDFQRRRRSLRPSLRSVACISAS